MKRIHVCIISPNYPPSDRICGVGDYTKKISEEFSRMGHRITILASKGYKGPEESGNIRVIRFCKKWDFFSFLRLWRLVKKSGFKLVNIQYTPVLYNTSFKLPLGLINTIVPVVPSFHTLHRSSVLSKIESLVLIKSCRGIISTNEEITYMLNKTRWIKKTFSEIPIGSNIIPPDKNNMSKRKAKKKLGLDEKDLILTNFGLFYPGKGLETLIRGCSLLKEKKINFKLILLGSLRSGDLSYIQVIKNLINRLDIHDKIILTGFIEAGKVTQYLRATDIFIVPFDRGASIRRGSLMAGIVHELPIITTFPEIPSRYIDGKTMALIPPKNPSSLVDKVIELTNDTKKLHEFERNVSNIKQKFIWSDISRRIIREFYRMLEKTA
ncbi:MAG: glycosyltransferase [Candidatus Aminicenantes bacterium]|nr:glycosyltransferase [Candidatus Aminicenantes bacterium]